jgi:putative flippase GtrA
MTADLRRDGDARTARGGTSHAPMRFVIVGLANTAAGLAVIYGAKWLGLGDAPANAVGYAAGLCLSFALNKSWTFRYAGPTLPALARFLVVIACAYALNLVTVLQAIGPFGVNAYLAQALGIVPYTLFTYFASRWYAFRPAPLATGRVRR